MANRICATCNFKRHKNGLQALLDLADACAADRANHPAARCAHMMQVRQRTDARARMRCFSSTTPCTSQFNASAAAKEWAKVKNWRVSGGVHLQSSFKLPALIVGPGMISGSAEELITALTPYTLRGLLLLLIAEAACLMAPAASAAHALGPFPAFITRFCYKC